MKRFFSFSFVLVLLIFSPVFPQSADSGLNKSLALADQIAKEGHFSLALELLRQAATEPGVNANDVEKKRKEIFESAKKKSKEILTESAALQAKGKLNEAIAYIEKFQNDFPPHKDFIELTDRIEILKAKLAEEKLAKENAQTGESKSSTVVLRFEFPRSAPAEFTTALEQARQLEKEFKFEGARAAYLELLKTAPDDASRHLLAGLVEDSQREAWFISALVDSFNESLSRFRGIDSGAGTKFDLTAVTAQGIEKTEGNKKESQTWKDLPLELFPRIIARASLDPVSTCDAAVFLYRNAFTKDADRLLTEALKKDSKQQERIDAVLARSRQEEIPSYGYVWFQERWMSFREREQWKAGEEIEKKVATLEQLPFEERTPAFEALLNYGPTARVQLIEILKKRRDVLVAKIQEQGIGPKIKKLQSLRNELDKRRKFANELIFDEEKYFYPYRVPECPPEKAALYPAVQAEVDKRVAAVREIWNSPELVAVAGKAQTLIRDIHQLQNFLEQLGMSSVLIDPLLEALLTIDPDDESVSIRNFCMNRQEKTLWRNYNRKVLTWNAVVDTTASPEELKQVAITNDYRIMMGLRVVAVNDKLLRAAREHSEEMETLKYFSHFSPTAGLKTPFDRMKREGYDDGSSENIAMGASDAQGAHDGWAHSSGHHRNILTPGHRELGSGNHGAYWTQNFGHGKEFQESTLWPKE